MRTWLTIIIGTMAMVTPALALDVPLTVKETKGISRIDNPVNSGVPLPKGAVKETSELRLLDADGKVVCASIEPRCRWLGDESLKWVTVHFIVPSLPANGTLNFKLTTSNAPLPMSSLAVTKGDKTITVVTGPAKFVIPTAGQFGPFEQVYLSGSNWSWALGDAQAKLAKPASATLVARNGESRVVPRPNSTEEFKTELVKIDDQPFTQTAMVQSAEVEETGPGRAVVALRGTFSTKEHPSLDFVARLYFYNGSALAQMTFSVINAQMDAWTHFVAIDRLAVEIPMKEVKVIPPCVTFEVDGREFGGPLGTRLVQTATDKLTVTGFEKPLEGRKSDGWMRFNTSSGEFTTGTRWFWQVHPCGFGVGEDCKVGLDLKAPGTERVDLYTGGAKTQFMFFQFGPLPIEGANPAAVAAGTMYPLVAACSADWYCQDTRAFGDLFSTNPKLYDPKYQDLVARYQKKLDSCLQTVVANRPRPGWKIDEYGWLNFGSGIHQQSYVRENAAETWWDANYYDFPHACVLNYLRTADPFNLTTAEEAGLHLADLDICHCFPGDPAEAGSPRSGPVVGHFRNYTRGQNYEAHNSFTFYKNESLYELYYLTGERWYHDIGLMSSNFAMNRYGQGALRNLAHGIWGVLSAYRDTHDQKYLDRAKFFVDKWGKPWQDGDGGGFDNPIGSKKPEQLWMYGLLFEAYDKYYRVSGDQATAAYLVKALDEMMVEFWKPNVKVAGHDGINLLGYGVAYDYTGDRKYFDKGLILLEKLADSAGEGDRVKTFAQEFRGSPYFLKALTVGYKPTPVVATSQPEKN